MDSITNNSSAQHPGNNSNIITGNYHQPQADGKDQTVLINPAITTETDELDLSFQQQAPPKDPEDDQEDVNEDDFPAEEDLEDDDFDLNRDKDDDLSLNIDDEELN